MSFNGTSHKQRLRKAAELKAVADALKEQRAEIQERLDAAMGEYLKAERECKRYEPLTPSMKAVLEALVKHGASITESELFGHSFWVDMPPDSDADNLTVRASVFYGLLSREALEPRKYAGGFRYTYAVSEHGKTLV